MNDSLKSIGTEYRSIDTMAKNSSQHLNPPAIAKSLAITGFLAVAVFAATPAGAVSLTNGDFETGDLTGWTVFTTTNGTNGSGLPNVALFNTTGSGASNSARFEVGSGGGGITQNVTLASGILNLSVDVAAFSLSNNASGGVFTLLLNTFDTGSMSVNTTSRNTLTSSTTVNAGIYSVGIQMTRPYGSGTGNTPYQYVDNFAISGSSTATTVPEPFTVIGSLIGGTAAFRMRKKLKSSNKV
jgi:hypothetical protein